MDDVGAESETLVIIKDVIRDVARACGVRIYRIILFGSRARGDYREDSDWDILVVTEDIDRRTFWKLYIGVKRSLHRRGIKADVIIVSRSIYERKKKVVNNIAYVAETEGITIWTTS